MFKASFTLFRFSVPASLRCGQRGSPGPQCSDAGKHRIESGYTVLNRGSPGSGPGGFTFLKQPGLSGIHRAAKQRRLIPGHHRSSSDMKRISTVSPSGGNYYTGMRCVHGGDTVTPGLATVCHGGEPV